METIIITLIVACAIVKMAGMHYGYCMYKLACKYKNQSEPAKAKEQEPEEPEEL